MKASTIRSQLLFLFLISLLFISCQKDDIKAAFKGYLVFGHFYGECAGGENCVENYKLDQNQLLQDTKDLYPSFSKFYEGNYVKLRLSQFNIAKDLIHNFPRDLCKESDKVIGQPDAGDWGGLYLEFKHKGKRKFWLLDRKKVMFQLSIMNSLMKWLKPLTIFNNPLV
ncbi:hypothetical protein [Adhaeribacter rhizoryzae]|uniref:Lipoprotein n=1 Tax=Adhaeribacter rhizoryzae TaxID=2607907 RepID=A0A5M6D2G4_9BACT|nr:hypothetical protein [Adhaeribacter rhizoryzae]KAA5541668.1 hypothetical protein F0145_20060 [Adhaeribacter rhizoryzae]